MMTQAVPHAKGIRLGLLLCAAHHNQNTIICPVVVLDPSEQCTPKDLLSSNVGFDFEQIILHIFIYQGKFSRLKILPLFNFPKQVELWARKRGYPAKVKTSAPFRGAPWTNYKTR